MFQSVFVVVTSESPFESIRQDCAHKSIWISSEHKERFLFEHFGECWWHFEASHELYAHPKIENWIYIKNFDPVVHLSTY